MPEPRRTPEDLPNARDHDPAVESPADARGDERDGAASQGDDADKDPRPAIHERHDNTRNPDDDVEPGNEGVE